MLLFRGLKGREVVVNLTGGDAVAGTVIAAGWISVAVSSLAEARTFEVIPGDPRQPGGRAEGVARIPFWSISFVQVL